MNKQIEFIDIMKGFAILLVVVGHFYLRNVSPFGYEIPVYNFIYTFHMPLFFFAGGYLAFISYKSIHVSEFPKFLLNKFRAILIPYFLWYAIFNHLFDKD